jgi:hypothetical protein
VFDVYCWKNSPCNNQTRPHMHTGRVSDNLFKVRSPFGRFAGLVYKCFLPGPTERLEETEGSDIRESAPSPNPGLELELSLASYVT